MTPVQRELLSEVCQLFKLLLVIPATNAVSEWSFSALQRVKTYLRSTMAQDRLNHIMTLHTHRGLTDDLSLIESASRFIHGSDHREQILGNLWQLILKNVIETFYL